MKVLFILIFAIICIVSPISGQDIDTEHLQTVLNREGYRAGPTDGDFGRKTRDSLIAFQKAHGLPQKEGRIDEETVIALRNVRKLEPKESGKAIHLEIDIDRQLLYIVEGGEILNIIHASTGRNEKPQPVNLTYIKK